MSIEFDDQKRNETGIWGGKLTKQEKATIAEGIVKRYEELAVDIQEIFPRDRDKVGYYREMAENVRDRHITYRKGSSPVIVSDKEG